MKNKLIDLNNALFEQLERLNDDDLTQEELDKEMSRSRAMVSVGHAIIKNGELALKAESFKFEADNDRALPEFLLGDKK